MTSTLKRSTQAHLATAYVNRNDYLADRKAVADHLRGYRKWFGAAEARRRHRTLHGPLLPLD